MALLLRACELLESRQGGEQQDTAGDQVRVGTGDQVREDAPLPLGAYIKQQETASNQVGGNSTERSRTVCVGPKNLIFYQLPMGPPRSHRISVFYPDRLLLLCSKMGV